jgi:hypothetical protein
MPRNEGTGITGAQARRLAKLLVPFRARFDSDREMAKAWGIAQNQVSGLLRARRRCGLAVLCRIRKHTGLTIDDLLGLAPLAEQRR